MCHLISVTLFILSLSLFVVLLNPPVAHQSPYCNEIIKLNHTKNWVNIDSPYTLGYFRAFIKYNEMHIQDKGWKSERAVLEHNDIKIPIVRDGFLKIPQDRILDKVSNNGDTVYIKVSFYSYYIQELYCWVHYKRE